jgi:hypothetical protein
MMKNRSPSAAGSVLLAWLCATSAAWAGDQAKAIVNSLDPKNMNALFDAAPAQPGAALTNIVPNGPNKFRFLFIWPDSNPLMTYDRVHQSFVERFTAFAKQLKPLAAGYCLGSGSALFGTTTYGQQEVNVAYRDIEVYYRFGWQPACRGLYIKAADMEQLKDAQTHHRGYGAALPAPPPSLPAQDRQTPADQLKPFLSAPPAAPPLE